MIERLVASPSIALARLLAVLGLAALGVCNFQRLPIDAVPDITNVQVQINTEAPGYSPLEAEQRITFPIETAIAGLPRLDYTRSLSRYGLSQVTVVFEDGTDIYFARQLVNERLQQARGQLPAGHRAEHGPDRHRARRNLHVHRRARARREQGPTARPRRRRICARSRTGSSGRSCAHVPGVTEVNTIGGYASSSTSRRGPESSPATVSALATLSQALTANNANVGAGYVERRGEQYLIRVPGQVAAARGHRAASSLPCATGCPSASRDVADVLLGEELRTGAATRERPRGRARHGLHAGRREQPHRLAARRGEAGEDRRQLAGGRPVTTGLRPHDARRPHDRHRRDQPARRRACWSSSCCSCCSATSGPRSSPPLSSRSRCC